MGAARITGPRSGRSVLPVPVALPGWDLRACRCARVRFDDRFSTGGFPADERFGMAG